MNEQEALKQEIKKLPLSQELKEILQKNGVESLEDLLHVEVFKWHKYPGFNYHHQHEIINYLKRNNLLKYLKEE